MVQQDSSVTGDIHIPVVGNSMVPMLIEGDIVTVSPLDTHKLVCGDIIIRWNNEFIVHRVVAVNTYHTYTTGDACYWMDPVHDVGNIIGKVRLITRSGQQADMDQFQWRLINRMIGYTGWLQVKFVWKVQVSGNRENGKNWLHGPSYWMSKRLNSVILFLFEGHWYRYSIQGKQKYDKY